MANIGTLFPFCFGHWIRVRSRCYSSLTVFIRSTISIVARPTDRRVPSPPTSLLFHRRLWHASSCRFGDRYPPTDAAFSSRVSLYRSRRRIRYGLLHHLLDRTGTRHYQRWLDAAASTSACPLPCVGHVQWTLDLLAFTHGHENDHHLLVGVVVQGKRSSLDTLETRASHYQRLSLGCGLTSPRAHGNGSLPIAGGKRLFFFVFSFWRSATDSDAVGRSRGPGVIHT
jgi:hypothetical protein